MLQPFLLIGCPYVSILSLMFFALNLLFWLFAALASLSNINKSCSLTRFLVGRLSNCLGARFEGLVVQSFLPLLKWYSLLRSNLTATGEMHIRSMIFLETSSDKVGVVILWIETKPFSKALPFLISRSSWSFGIYLSRLCCKEVSPQFSNGNVT